AGDVGGLPARAGDLAGGEGLVAHHPLARHGAGGWVAHGQPVVVEVALPVGGHARLSRRHRVDQILVAAAHGGAGEQEQSQPFHRSGSSMTLTSAAPTMRASLATSDGSSSVGTSTERKKPSTAARAKESHSKTG